LDGELLSGGWVYLLVSVQHDLEAWKKVVRPYNFGRIGVTGQCNCLANCCKRASDCAILDLVSVTIVTCADACRKTGEDLDPL
jgi:hypothetical protein